MSLGFYDQTNLLTKKKEKKYRTLKIVKKKIVKQIKLQKTSMTKKTKNIVTQVFVKKNDK